MSRHSLEELIAAESLYERTKALPHEVVVAGAMGGSASAAYALSFINPAKRLVVHEDYDLPLGAPASALYLAISYSGTTEETISFAREALRRKYLFAAIASGGELVEMARLAGAPVAIVPEGVEPRNALPLMLGAALTLLGESATLKGVSVERASIANEAHALAALYAQKTPVFYASSRNALLARIGKMFCNETAKIPAFASIVPARNHDELQSFDPAGPHASTMKFSAVLVRDADDHPRIRRRFEVMREVLTESGIAVYEMHLSSGPRAQQLLSGWLLLQAAAEIYAQERGVDPIAIPLTEGFKKRL